jgi:hypothetical protein
VYYVLQQVSITAWWHPFKKIAAYRAATIHKLIFTDQNFRSRGCRRLIEYDPIEVWIRLENPYQKRSISPANVN